MNGEQLYKILRGIWRSPAHVAWGLFTDAWNEADGEFFLGPARRRIWEQCAESLMHGGQAEAARESIPENSRLATVAEVEDQLLVSRIAHFGGDKERAAKSLGISLKTAYNWLKRIDSRNKRLAE